MEYDFIIFPETVGRFILTNDEVISFRGIGIPATRKSKLGKLEKIVNNTIHTSLLL